MFSFHFQSESESWAVEDLTRRFLDSLSSSSSSSSFFFSSITPKIHLRLTYVIPNCERVPRKTSVFHGYLSSWEYFPKLWSRSHLYSQGLEIRLTGQRQYPSWNKTGISAWWNRKVTGHQTAINIIQRAAVMKSIWTYLNNMTQGNVLIASLDTKNGAFCS